MANRAQLVEAALLELKAIASGQAASPEDHATVDAKLEPMLADLAAREISYVGDVENIDDAQMMWLPVILARRCALAFSVTGQELRDLDAAAREAEDRLETLARGAAARRTLRLDSALRPRRR
jgi:hypothetical protein